MEDLISVIVPVYKVEKYLEKCVHSIANQTYSNLEIILVDDGSPDNSPQICDELAKKDNRIKVIHKENGGLSSSRNAGLEVFNGQYVAFIDSDDTIEPTFIEDLYKALMENDCDLAVCGVKCVNENDEELSLENVLPYKKIDLENKFDLLFEKNLVTSIISCNKLYARHIFEKIRYAEGRIHEDEFIIYDIIDNVKQGIALVDKPLYLYLKRSGSITAKQKASVKMFDYVYAMKERLEKVGTGLRYYPMAVVQLFNAYITVYTKVRRDKNLRREILKMAKVDFKLLKKYFPTFKLKLKFYLFNYVPLLVAKIVERKMNKRR